MSALSVCVAGHPSRGCRLLRLTSLLGADLVSDPEPDAEPLAWRTMRLAWLRTPGWCTHRLVLQDDALPVVDAVRLAQEAVTAAPGMPVVLYAGVHHPQLAAEVEQARAAGRDFCVCPDGVWVPTVALALPRADALDLVRFADEVGYVGRADDAIVADWARRRRHPVMVRVPSLFDHDDSMPSLCSPSHRYARRAVALEDETVRIAC